MSKVNVAVAISDEAQGRIYEVAAACRAVGLQHRTTLTAVGVLTGLVESDYLWELETVPGVLAVEVQQPALGDQDGFRERRAKSETSSADGSLPSGRILNS